MAQSTLAACAAARDGSVSRTSAIRACMDSGLRVAEVIDRSASWPASETIPDAGGFPLSKILRRKGRKGTQRPRGTAYHRGHRGAQRKASALEVRRFESGEHS